VGLQVHTQARKYSFLLSHFSVYVFFLSFSLSTQLQRCWRQDQNQSGKRPTTVFLSVCVCACLLHTHTCLNTRCSHQITQWGSGFRFGDTGGYFYGCSNLQITATDAPDLTGTTNMTDMFADAPGFNGDLSSWDVASVTNMQGMFFRATAFNSDLSSWAVASVTHMPYMFQFSATFNGNLSSWDVANVTDMGYMFQSSTAFNGDLSSWAVASVINMEYMFQFSTAFNGDLSAWSVGSVLNCPGFCGGGSSSICGVPIFPACTSGCTGGRTIQTYGGSLACSCPAGQTGTPGTDTVCGTHSLELTQK
jgi:surface protein